jgi:hypothetical protein
VAARFVDELDFGFGWISPEPGFMQRCSHALVVGGKVWLIDPVFEDGVLDRIRALGEPAGVVQLVDRHARDCTRLADELGVPHLEVPRAAPVGAPFEVIPVIRRRRWREVALWIAEHRTLVCTEAIGTAQYYRAPSERLAVHPLLRLTPPRVLLRIDPPARILVGHGAGVHDEAPAALRDAIVHARRRTPAWLWAGLRAHDPLRRTPTA